MSSNSADVKLYHQPSKFLPVKFLTIWKGTFQQIKRLYKGKMPISQRYGTKPKCMEKKKSNENKKKEREKKKNMSRNNRRLRLGETQYDFNTFLKPLLEDFQ